MLRKPPNEPTTPYRHSRRERSSRHDFGSASPCTWKFSIDVATSWEQSFFAAITPNVRKVALRSAMIMSPDHGGVFDQLLRLVRFGLGGAAGSGRQFVSWIHDTDFLRSIDYLI